MASTNVEDMDIRPETKIDSDQDLPKPIQSLACLRTLKDTRCRLNTQRCIPRTDTQVVTSVHNHKDRS